VSLCAKNLYICLCRSAKPRNRPSFRHILTHLDIAAHEWLQLSENDFYQLQVSERYWLTLDDIVRCLDFRPGWPLGWKTWKTWKCQVIWQLPRKCRGIYQMSGENIVAELFIAYLKLRAISVFSRLLQATYLFYRIFLLTKSFRTFCRDVYSEHVALT